MGAVLIAGASLLGFLAWFSVWTTPHLNADQAIHILMAERFDVARDAYYWGQDRLGSLLPALGAVLVALGVPSLDALAWVQLGVLLASGLVWLRLLRNPVLGALGFAAMLLPVFPFHESVAIGHPYLAQQFFGLLWLSVLDRGTGTQGGALRALGLPLLGLAALWASELSLPFLVASAWYYRRSLVDFVRSHPWASLAGSLVGGTALTAAKLGAPKQRGFGTLLADPSDLVKSISIQWSEWSTTLLFEGNKPFNGLYWWTALVLVGLVAGAGLRQQIKPSRRTASLAVGAAATWLLVHASGWSAANGFPLRYFAAAFGLGALALGSYASDLGWGTRRSHWFAALGLVALQGWAAWSFSAHFSTGAKGRLDRVQAEALAVALASERQPAAVMGSYWNAYLVDGLSGKVVGLPFEGEHCRNRRYEGAVLNADSVAFIGNGWLDVLPDSLNQYGRVWTAAGSAAEVNGVRYRWYRKGD